MSSQPKASSPASPNAAKAKLSLPKRPSVEERMSVRERTRRQRHPDGLRHELRRPRQTGQRHRLDAFLAQVKARRAMPIDERPRKGRQLNAAGSVVVLLFHRVRTFPNGPPRPHAFRRRRWCERSNARRRDRTRCATPAGPGVASAPSPPRTKVMRTHKRAAAGSHRQTLTKQSFCKSKGLE